MTVVWLVKKVIKPGADSYVAGVGRVERAFQRVALRAWRQASVLYGKD